MKSPVKKRGTMQEQLSLWEAAEVQTAGEASVRSEGRPDAAVQPKRSALKRFPRGKETILYVDDEESLALLGKEMLSLIGYHVIPCIQSTEALRIFRDDPERFDLIITDYTMPFMNGAELAQKILEVRNDIPVILSTGFSPSITREKIQQTGIREFITKPISIRDLALIIRKVLDENRRPAFHAR
jgi:DNA-binding NtrC family response regulator